MKLIEAMSIISGASERSGFCIHFEVREGGMLRSDYFPDVRNGEPGIERLEGAWAMAEEFAKASPREKYVNIYVVSAVDFVPAPGVRKKIRPYP